jgi:uncharacterized protein (DUF4213/DUF364 family)
MLTATNIIHIPVGDAAIHSHHAASASAPCQMVDSRVVCGYDWGVWEIYDALIEGIPEGVAVAAWAAGRHWAAVRSDEGGVGLAMRVDVESIAPAYGRDYAGMPLRELAGYAKSWNFVEAGFGVAAMNAFYNHAERARARGIALPDEARKNEAFEKYREAVAGKKVAVVGHFPYLERILAPVCDLCILERRPSCGDYPDPACEYILPNEDYVFITGSALVNKTLPRLLELSRSAWTVLVGPSVTLSPSLFDFGADDLSGFIVRDGEQCFNAVRSGEQQSRFAAGTMVNYRRAGNTR